MNQTDGADSSGASYSPAFLVLLLLCFRTENTSCDMENGFTDLDKELARLDDELMSLTNQFTDFAEEILPPLTDRLLSLKELSQQRDKHAVSLKNLYTSLDREIANFFDLDTDENASEKIDSLMERERQEVESIDKELEEVKQSRRKVEKELEHVLQQLKSNEEQVRKLDQEEEQRLEAEKTSKMKDMYHLMGTKFRVDKDKRLVALILGEEERVEEVVLVNDKDSSPEESVNEYWERAAKIDT